MRPEKRRLIDELLDDASGTKRAVTLLAGRRILRYKRWRRRVGQGLALALWATVVAFWPHIRTPPEPVTTVSTATPPVRFLTDDQLLALFPNTPVGLAIVDGRKVLIFPRPGDADKFIGRF